MHLYYIIYLLAELHTQAYIPRIKVYRQKLLKPDKRCLNTAQQGIIELAVADVLSPH